MNHAQEMDPVDAHAPSGPTRSGPIALTRDCPAFLIPDGTPVVIPQGGLVTITQALGDSVTVLWEGNLARVGATEVEALGLKPTATVGAGAVSSDDPGCLDEQVWAALRTCYDPEIPINIVELGLIYGCRSEACATGQRVAVTMTLTAPGCGMGPILVEDVRGKISRIPQVSEVTVDLVFDPPWSFDRMSEAARLEAGLY